MELIQQIKSSESMSSSNRAKFIDLTSTAGYGLLSEMSIVELKERLDLTKQQWKEVNAQRHDQIIENKIKKDKDIINKLEFITAYRKETAKLEKKTSLNHLRNNITNDLHNNDKDILELKQQLAQTKHRRLNNKSIHYKSENDLKTKLEKKQSVYADQRVFY
jgi:hypothetical protein